MSLPTGQERILRRMAHSLHASEPHLTSMFAMFTKLTRDEDMPRLEEIDAWSVPFWRWRQRPARSRRARGPASSEGAAHAPDARLRDLLLVPIMLAALASAIILGLGGHSVNRCGPAARPQHTQSAPSRHRSCLSVPQRLAYPGPPRG